MRKKILFLSPLPPPFYGSAMSSETCLEVLTESNGFVVKNIKLNRSEDMSDMGRVSLKKIIGFASVLFSSAKAMVFDKPDLVYVMPATAGLGFIRDFGVLLIAKVLGANVLIHLRTTISDKDRKSLFKKKVFEYGFHDSRVIVLSERLKGSVKGLVRDEDVSILFNAIQMTLAEEEFRPLLQQRLEWKKMNLLFLSNMMKSKGWQEVLEVAKLLRDEGVDFSLKFAGSWLSEEDRESFTQFVNENNLEKYVVHLGRVDTKAKRELLSQTDLLLFPTRYKNEALPRVIIEAMEFGVPSVSTFHAGIPDIIEDGHNGFLVGDSNPDDMLDCIKLAKDKERLRTISLKARKSFLAHHELKVFSEKFLSIIEDAVGQRQVG